MAPHELDLSTSDQVSENEFINNAYKEELELYKWVYTMAHASFLILKLFLNKLSSYNIILW